MVIFSGNLTIKTTSSLVLVVFCNILLSLIFQFSNIAFAQAEEDLLDPMDPFSGESYEDYIHSNKETDPSKKSADELLQEAYTLQLDERLLDARTKLLQALKKEPSNYKVHMLLADYYLRHVSHYRLAMKYTKQALDLFTKQHGSPPYSEIDFLSRAIHADLLNLLHNVRLNLDDYQGALAALQEFETLNYYDSWLPGSKAWVLMKLNRLQEAINVAQAGMAMEANQGQTLNILGILLSMTNEREKSIKVFQKAIAYELSLSEKDGRPATPLNNIGEVYKETFNETESKKSFRKALLLPDGCEHVLPSLNLALVLIEELNFAEAKNAIDSFEQCIAKFPLRNEEEHKAFVAMAKGRIALHTGRIDDSLKYLEAALQRRQWFGKVGTNEDDLKVAVMISLAQSLEAKNKIESFRTLDTWTATFGYYKDYFERELRSAWLLRRARQILANDLNNAEDIYIRHTDSMLEYPTFGDALAGFPVNTLDKRIKVEEKNDNREEALVYYKAYLAQNKIENGDPKQGIELAKKVLNELRPDVDRFLALHMQIQILKTLATNTKEYRESAYQIYEASRASLRNNGLRLPVNIETSDKKVYAALKNAPFLIADQEKLPFEIKHEQKSGKCTLRFESSLPQIVSTTVTASDCIQAVNSLVDTIFSDRL